MDETKVTYEQLLMVIGELYLNNKVLSGEVVGLNAQVKELTDGNEEADASDAKEDGV